jgi:hypothetical protein
VNPFRSLLRSCRRFFCKRTRFPRIAYLVTLLELIMADLAPIKASLDALDAKVTAHLDADGAAVLEMVKVNEALQVQVTDLTAALAAAGATPEDIAAVVAQVDAIAAKL